ncbi:MAG: sulfatase-like hydrolase/transferase [Candidatus Aminicenantes bacterium]|nr:sulfatase-like hydrolase/transferase [Candidatus Aminicenantes bacterium]
MKNKKIVIPIIAVMAAVFFLLSLQACKERGTGVNDLNILLITLDTTRADHIGAYGHGTIKTPHIDDLCNKGVMFQNCYSPVPLTLPSHCSMFTGKYPIGHGVRNNSSFRLISDECNLAELLKKRGYHTHAVIAAFVLIAKFGLNQGFDIYDDTFSTAEIPADEVYKKFKSWFDANLNKIFFSWVHFYDPHDPYEPPAEYVEKGSENDDLKRYSGEIEFVDKHVGKIIEDLKSSGILSKTLVIIAGDHGEGFGEHNEYGHSIFCYEEDLKVPLIFYNETMFKEKSIGKRVNLVDLMPTVLDLLGMQIPGEVQGRSFLPMMKGKEEAEERTFYFESIYGNEEFNWAPITGMITGDYKYISLPEPEFYNLKSDKGERKNIFREKFNMARKYDEKLKELILTYSTPGSSEKSKRDLTEKDIRRLESLGYISAFSNKSKQDIQVDPKKGVVVYNILKSFSEQIKKGENLDRIEDELKKILEETPELKTPLVFTLLHDIYKERQDLTAALKILKEGVQEFPGVYRFRYRLAAFLYQLKRYDEVIEQGRIILKENPLYARAYVLLGNVYNQGNNSEETVKNFREALDLEPDNVPVKMKYAGILVDYRRFIEAVEVYNSMLDATEVANNHNFLFKIAMINTRYGTMEMAERILYRLTHLKPSGKYFFYYAIALAKNRKFREAIKQMEKALNEYSRDLTPDQQQQAHNALGMWKRSR